MKSPNIENNLGKTPINAQSPTNPATPVGERHPQRCDNGCTHYDVPCPGFPCCDKNENGEMRSLSQSDIDFILVNGCASHSSAQSAQPADAPEIQGCDVCKFSEQCRHTPYIPPCYNHGLNAQEAATAAKAEGRQEERDDVLLQVLSEMEKNQGGGIHTGWILAEPLFHCIEVLRSTPTTPGIQERDHP